MRHKFLLFDTCLLALEFQVKAGMTVLSDHSDKHRCRLDSNSGRHLGAYRNFLTIDFRVVTARASARSYLFFNQPEGTLDHLANIYGFEHMIMQTAMNCPCLMVRVENGRVEKNRGT